jgi:hypothetical protein
VPSILIERLDVNGAPARIQNLSLPLYFLLASKNESVTISRASLVTMQYQTSAGPLLLRNVPSLILEDDSTEILVGEQLLLDLGFDPQQLLADACIESNDRDCSHVPSAMIHGRDGLISRVMLQRDAAGPFLPIPLVDVHNLSDAFLIDGNLCNISEPSDFNAEEDVDSSSKSMENEFALDIGPDSDADTLNALSNLLATAKINGMSDDGVAKLDALLVDFRDIWRLRLGNDPPADVPPMEIRMKPDVSLLSRRRVVMRPLIAHLCRPKWPRWRNRELFIATKVLLGRLPQISYPSQGGKFSLHLLL